MVCSILATFREKNLFSESDGFRHHSLAVHADHGASLLQIDAVQHSQLHPYSSRSTTPTTLRTEDRLETKKARGRTGLSITGHSTNALIVQKDGANDVAREQLRLILRKSGTK